MSDLRRRIAELGLELPPVPEPKGAYRPLKLVGTRWQSSGILPLRAEGGLITAAEAAGDTDRLAEACRTAALNLLALLADRLGQAREVHLDHLRGFVVGGAGFREGHIALNGASELLGEVLGSRGIHTREAVHAAGLPLDAAVELAAYGRWQ